MTSPIIELIKMENSFKIDPKKLLVEFKLTGVYSFSEFKNFFESVLSHPDFKPGFKILCDAQDMDFSKMTPDDIYELVKLDNEIRVKRGAGKTAFLVKGDLQFGLSRMLELQRDINRQDPLRVFKNPDEARRWLGI